jgi:NADPH2 dehydrogenase
MSKYFHYASVDDLRKDVRERGLNINFEEKIDRVLKPVKIGNRIIGNALGIHPMEGCDADLDGSPGPLTYRRWERFGEGGAKLIWGEATAVYEEARANPRQLLINEKNLSHFEDLVRRTKKSHINIYGSDSDLCVGLQLTHSGRYSYKRPFLVYHHPDVDAMTYLDKTTGTYIPTDYPLITDDYLERLEDQFLKIAIMVEKVGFDFVDIKQCHTYLLSELLGARNRHGKYGGSFENRTRFVRNVIEKIKGSVGKDFIIASRINAYDGIPYRQNPVTGVGEPVPYPLPYPYSFGVDVENPLREDLTEVKQLLRMLIEKGVSLVNVSMGSPYYNMHLGRPYEKPPVDGYSSPEHPLEGIERHFRITGELQQAFPDLPMVGTGYSWLQKFLVYAAEANMRDKMVAIVSTGRGAIAYPDYVKDLMDYGEMNRSKVCIAVSYCTNLMRSKHNEFGQFETGCVPRDTIYAKIYKESLKTKDQPKKQPKTERDRIAG